MSLTTACQVYRWKLTATLAAKLDGLASDAYKIIVGKQAGAAEGGSVSGAMDLLVAAAHSTKSAVLKTAAVKAKAKPKPKVKGKAK